MNLELLLHGLVEQVRQHIRGAAGARVANLKFWTSASRFSCSRRKAVFAVLPVQDEKRPTA